MQSGCLKEFAELSFTGNGASYGHIADISTLGLDRWWKQRILWKIPANPAHIIDLACGTGILTFKIARRFPQCKITGADLQEGYLSIARQRARELRLNNVGFIRGDAEKILLDGHFDCITSSYLAKYVDLDIVVANAREMLRDGGVLIVHELTYPANAFWAWIIGIHFKLLQTYVKWMRPEWETSFRDLPTLIRETKWVDELTKALRANNFSDIKIDPLAFGASAIVSARK